MANITGITKISYAKGLGGLSSSIKYATQGSPHYNDHGHIHNRAFVIQGFNCPDSPKLAYLAMRSTLNTNYVTHMNICCVRDIESFRGLNYKSKKDRNIALNLDTQFIHKKFPHNQVLIVGHLDNFNHIIHFHNLVCARRLDNGQSVAHNSSFFKTAPVFDKVLIKNGYTPLNHGHLEHSKVNNSRGVLYHNHLNNSYISRLTNSIDKSIKYARNSYEFKRNLSHYGISVERFKMTTINGHREPKLYNHITRGGHFKNLSNGKYLRFRKHFSYSFMSHNKKIIIRERKLGSNYSLNSIFSKLNKNKLYYERKKFRIKPRNSPQFASNNTITRAPHNTHNISLSLRLKHWEKQEQNNQNKQANIMRKADDENNAEIKKNKINDVLAFIKLMMSEFKDLHHGYNSRSW